MGPMNDDYGLTLGNAMMDTVVTPNTFLKNSLPSETLGSTTFVANSQPERPSHMDDIFQAQMFPNNNSDFQPPDNSYIPNESMTSEQTLYNNELPFSDYMYCHGAEETPEPEQALIDNDFQTTEEKYPSNTMAIPVQTLSGTINEISDGDLKKAAEEMKKSGSQLPILKQELWLKIQSKRLASGQPELKIENEAPKVYKLTPKEEQNLERRRENNRQSAKKCRQKKKDETKGLFRKHKELKKKNEDLKKMVEKLEALKSHYWSELVTYCPVDNIPAEDLYKHINPDFDEQQMGDGA